MNSVGALRTGDAVIPQTSVNALLAGGTPNSSTPAPGVFSIGGIFTDPQFQLVIRGLNQKKGIDLMSAPKVTTKSGQKAIIKITQEFIYPKQYDPPQIPQAVSNTGVPPTITPSFPRNFTTQDLGVVLDAKPTIGPDGYTIDLELDPKVVDFDGFINYGSPINAVGYTESFQSGILTQTPVVQTLTTNTINQPVFTTREVNTFVTVWDGQTISLGGLITENVLKAQDKVPFLGDIPLAGRLFRSNNDQKIKQNLIIFVTPKIIDPEGQPRRDDSEDMEIVKPLGLPQDLPQPLISSPASRSK
jgi:general secretion pathway protein D